MGVTDISQVLRLLVFGGFFAFAALCIALGSRDERYRTAFVSALVVGLLVPTGTGVLFPPFAEWHFFPEPAPQNSTTYSATVVDADGDEYEYPPEAAAPGRVYDRIERAVTGAGPVTPRELAAALLDRARTHRAALSDGLSPGELMAFRSQNARFIGRDTWSPATARAMDALHGLRMYWTTIETADRSYRVQERRRTMVYEHWDNASR